MQINNGEVMTANGLELETGFSTSAEIAEMDSRLNFVGGYKWEMGDVNAFYVKKQLLSNKTVAGKRYPYRGRVTKVAQDLLKQQGIDPSTVSKEQLFTKFNNDTDIQAVVDYCRTILTVVNGEKTGRRVLSPRIIDPKTKKKVPTTIDRLAKLTGDIHQILRDKQKNALKASGGVAQDVIDQTLKTFDQNNKLIKAVKTRVAMEICYFPVDKATFNYIPDKFTGLSGVIYTTNTDVYNAIKAKLHTADDTHLDYLEIKMCHPVSTKYGANQKMNKMDAGQRPGIETFKTENSPALHIPDFDELYAAYCETSIQSPEDLRSKVFDLQPITDEEAISLCKDYVIKNINILSEEDKKNNEDILKRFQSVLSAEEIAKITGSDVSKVTTNTQEADGFITDVPNDTQNNAQGSTANAQAGVMAGVSASNSTGFGEEAPDGDDGFNF